MLPAATVRVHRGLRRLLLVGATQRRPILRPATRWLNSNRTVAARSSLYENVVPTGGFALVARASALPARHVLADWVTDVSAGARLTGGGVTVVAGAAGGGASTVRQAENSDVPEGPVAVAVTC